MAETKHPVEENDPDEILVYPYPRGAIYVFVFAFCERFAFYSVRAILQMYLIDVLLFKIQDSNLIFSLFSVLGHFCAIIGAFMGDSPVGKFNTITYISLIYLCGIGILSMSAIATTKKPDRPVTIFGLCTIVLCSGILRPLLPAFGGDQFVLPEQGPKLRYFFAWLYFAANCGKFLSFLLTPLLRDIDCLGKDTCYSLAFGIPGIAMIVGVICSVAVRPMCNLGKQDYNIMLRVQRCLKFAKKEKRKSRGPAHEHWLDYAKPRFGSRMVEDIKVIFKLIIVLLPLVIFSTVTLLDETTAHVQAAQMDGDVKFFTIHASSMAISGPAFAIITIPLLYFCIYRLLRKCKLLETPLNRIACGGYLTILSLILSGVISIILAKRFPVAPSNNSSQLRIYNTFPCAITISDCPQISSKPIEIQSAQVYTKMNINFHRVLQGSVTWTYKIKGSCVPERDDDVDMYDKIAVGQYFVSTEGSREFQERICKPRFGNSHIRALLNPNGFKSDQVIEYVDSGREVKGTTRTDKTHSVEVPFGFYDVRIGDKQVVKLRLRQGGVYSLIGYATSPTHYRTFLRVVVKPNSLNMLWLLPQYLIVSLAKVMVIITEFEFLYLESPDSMKCIGQAYMVMLLFVGDAISATLSLTIELENRAEVQFTAAGILIIGTVAFHLLALKFFTYRNSIEWY